MLEVLTQTLSKPSHAFYIPHNFETVLRKNNKGYIFGIWLLSSRVSQNETGKWQLFLPDKTSSFP